ncbi:MAG TPA: SDR family oxidoreductase [Bacteroidota bacterium]|nr:SDR family oxidoreductase [Bacteroidota bacterium]
MNPELRFKKTDWAIILGASSGFGGATAIALARHGMNICGVHFDRAATMPQAEEIKKAVADTGVDSLFFNVNAADPAKRNEVLDSLQKHIGGNANAFVRVLMHSLAFGTLKPYISEKPEEMMTQQQVEMTMDVMANSIVYWVQGAFTRGLLRKGSRIYGMTSSGGRTQIPHYGAVSAAKAALESHIRQLTMELGAFGITANAIMAGVTDTPALRKIPAAKKLIDTAKAKNPQMRLTTPEDIAKAIVLLTHEYGDFVAGQVVAVDGGEEIVSYIGQKSARELE